MSEKNAAGHTSQSSIDELLELLGVTGKGDADYRLPWERPRTADTSGWRRDEEVAGPLTTEIAIGLDGVPRLHIYGCGRKTIVLSKSRCRVLVSGWTQLEEFALNGASADRQLISQITIRDVRGVVVAEVGGEIGRPLRFTPEKLAKLLKAKEAIRQFSGC